MTTSPTLAEPRLVSSSPDGTLTPEALETLQADLDDGRRDRKALGNDKCTRFDLVAHQSDHLRIGADEHQSRIDRSLGEGGILGQADDMSTTPIERIWLEDITPG